MLGKNAQLTELSQICAANCADEGQLLQANKAPPPTPISPQF